MTTEYTHTATIAVPENLLADANQLALILGESPADNNTFRSAAFTDGSVNYSVVHTAVKQQFVDIAGSGDLKPTPDHAAGADRVVAEAALATVNKEGGIKLAIDVNPREQLLTWELQRIDTVVYD